MKYLPILVSLLLIGCEDEISEIEAFPYPLKAGNDWTYSALVEQQVYPGDEDIIGLVDTFSENSVINVHINGLKNHEKRKDLIEFSVTQTLEDDILYSVQYYYIVKDNLYLFGYEGEGHGTYALPKSIRSIAESHIDPIYYNPLPGDGFLSHIGKKSTIDSIYVEENPPLALSYPLTLGSQWTYREVNNPWQMEKIVEEEVAVPIGGTTYDCMRLRTYYDMDRNGEWDSNTWIDELISDKGLIERTLHADSLFYMDYSGSGMSGYYKRQWKYTLEEMDLN